MCKSKPKAYHPIRNLDVDVRDHILKQYVRIISITDIVFCITMFVLWAIMAAGANSAYYSWGFGCVPVLKLVALFYVLSRVNKYNVEECMIFQHTSTDDLCSFCSPSSANNRSIINWISANFGLFLFTALIALNPQLSFVDLTSPPTNTSSCTFMLSQIDTPYNPEGFFGPNEIYADDITLKFCPIDQTYGWPSALNFVYGYPTTPLTTTNYVSCPSKNQPFPSIPPHENVNGYVDTDFCDSYPSNAIGVIPPINENSFRSKYVLCPGNTALTTCISSISGYAYTPQIGESCVGTVVVGVPKKICPACLQWWRSKSGDRTGPPGYEHCGRYSDTKSYSFVCNFCPGRGIGWFPHEKYDYGTKLNNVIFSSIIEGLFIVEWFVLGFAFARLRSKMETRDLEEQDMLRKEDKANSDDPSKKI